ncbi:tetratricopeptide repeat protein [Asticcacaulis sp. W401b]|uniref:tetratricopeptide repeat protein n=1 Tax=Asticcacaulis sp. W401b TaxID=3388666 RepID=UPI003970E583
MIRQVSTGMALFMSLVAASTQVASAQTASGLPQASPAAGLSQAVSSLLEKAYQGDARSQVAIGQRYASGVGLPQNYGLAARWFTAAGEQNDPDGVFNLARLHYLGLGVEQDYGRALQLFEQLARAGNSDVQYIVAQMYAAGLGTPADAVTANKWLTLSALQGNALANVDLGNIYAEGIGVRADQELAIGYFRKALSTAQGPLKAAITERLLTLPPTRIQQSTVAGPVVDEVTQVDAELIDETIDPEVPVAGEELIAIMRQGPSPYNRDLAIPVLQGTAADKRFRLKLVMATPAAEVKAVSLTVKVVDATFIGRYCVNVPRSATGRIGITLYGSKLDYLEQYTVDTVAVGAVGLDQPCGAGGKSVSVLPIWYEGQGNATEFSIYLNNDGGDVAVYPASAGGKCADAGEGPYRLFRLICRVKASAGEVTLGRDGAPVIRVKLQ